MANILVLHHSMYGHIETMARLQGEHVARIAARPSS